jgi:dTDP-4-dehydrorhamnose 3,5-epimerase
VLLVKPLRHVDERGSFSETLRADLLTAHGVDVAFVQDNRVVSKRKGVVRLLALPGRASRSGKAREVLEGGHLDVAGGAQPMRSMSPSSCPRRIGSSYGSPPGFARGYVTVDDNCEVIYKTTD